MFRSIRCMLALCPMAATGFAQEPLAPAPETAPSSFWWQDFDLDGRQDAFVLTPAGEAHLLRNEGEGAFTDVTRAAGLSALSQARFAEWQDFDGDGRPDLYVGTGAGPSHLLRNLGDGAFEDVALQAGIVHRGADRSAHWLDVDADERPDLHVRTAGENILYRNLGRGLFQPMDLGWGASDRVVAPGGVSDTRPEAADGEPTRTETEEKTRPERAGRDSQAREPGVGSGRVAVAAPNAPGLSEPVGQPARMGAGLAITCADTIIDQATGLCIEASSTPSLGTLYPLSEDLNVSNLGRVGIGTTGPQDRLHVHEGDLRVSGSGGRRIVLRDGDNQDAFVLDASPNGTGNSFRTYHNGQIAGEDLPNTWGYQRTFYNTLEDQRVYSTGVSAADYSGFVQLNTSEGVTNVWLDSDLDSNPDGVYQGGVTVRSSGPGAPGGSLRLQNNDGATRIEALGGGSGDAGTLSFFDTTGSETIALDGDATYGAELRMFNGDDVATVDIDSDLTGAGRLALTNGISFGARIRLDGGGSGDGGGDVRVYAEDGSRVVQLDGQNTDDGGRVSVYNDTSAETVRLTGDDGDDSGAILLWDRSGTPQTTVEIVGRDAFGTGGEILLSSDTGDQTIEIDGADTDGGAITIWEEDGSIAMRFRSNLLTLYDSAGVARINMNGNTGAKNGIVQTDSYGERLLYAVESPEVWFEDVGSSQMQDGVARIDLDPIFLETVTVDQEHPLRVFVTLTGDCSGVFVEKATDHFVVRELAGGKSCASFDWRVMAKRRGLEDDRLEPFEEPFSAEAQSSDLPNERRAPIDGDDAEEGRVSSHAPRRAPVSSATDQAVRRDG